MTTETTETPTTETTCATTKKYSFDDHPEHKALLPMWRDKWIKNAMSTSAMTEEEKATAREALKDLYLAAGLPWHGRVEFVSSPFILRFAAGEAAAIWQARREGREPPVPVAQPPRPLDYTKWYTTTAGPLTREGLNYARAAHQMWQGGNQWSGWAAHLSFFRHIAKLDLDYSKWAPWETLAEVSGPRVVHADFAMVSDRPELLTVDDLNRPHNDTGPFCRWRDGSALYSIHGVRVPAWLIEFPDQLTVEKIDAEANAEVRRVMLDRYGYGRYLRDAGATVLDACLDEIGQPIRLLRREIPNDEAIVMVELVNSTVDPDGTRRTYLAAVPPTITSAIEARNWRCYLEPGERFDVQT